MINKHTALYERIDHDISICIYYFKERFHGDLPYSAIIFPSEQLMSFITKTMIFYGVCVLM